MSDRPDPDKRVTFELQRGWVEAENGRDAASWFLFIQVGRIVVCLSIGAVR